MILDLRAQSARASHSASARAGRSAAFVVVAAFVVSRICYAIMGVRFDASTLNHYHQLIDPALLKGSLIESIFYLRDQPPSFNLMCGVVLKASGAHAATVFHAVYLGLGLCASIAALQLMLRMGVGAITAAAIAILLTVNPTTVLYENWLLYEYPLMTGLIVAAWLLHRYASDRRLIDGATLFAVLALIVLTRGTFHPFWLVIVVVGVVLLDRAGARRTRRLAAAPLVLVAAVTLKNWVMFGEWAGSSVYRGLNLAVMTVDQLPREQCAELVRSGALSQAAVTPLYDRPPSAFVHLAPMGEPAGIAVLDQERKSTGAINWHHRAMPAIAAAYERDALYVLRHQPALYFGCVWKNLRRYFVPSHDTYPFNLAANANHARLKPALGFFDHWVGLRWGKTPYSWSALVLLPVLIAFAALAGVGPIRLRKRLMVTSMPDRAVLAFCLFNILYAAVTTILLSYGDHHRYRFALMPLYGVIAALLVSRVAAALGGAAQRRGQRPRRSRGSGPVDPRRASERRRRESLSRRCAGQTTVLRLICARRVRCAGGVAMPTLIQAPTRIQSAGNKPKIIQEFVGRVNSKTGALSVAQMKSPSGWVEPGQRPEFDEYTIVLKGTLRVEHEGDAIDVGAGQAVIARAGEWVRYSTPGPEGAEYIAVCLPAFSPETVHRDAE